MRLGSVPFPKEVGGMFGDKPLISRDVAIRKQEFVEGIERGCAVEK
jgi:hypothetical protein